TFGALPWIATELRAAVELLECRADPVLQLAQVADDGVGIVMGAHGFRAKPIRRMNRRPGAGPGSRAFSTLAGCQSPAIRTQAVSQRPACQQANVSCVPSLRLSWLAWRSWPPSTFSLLPFLHLPSLPPPLRALTRQSSPL